MDDVECSGDEGHIASCTFNGWGVTDCTHHEDVGVRCNRRPLEGFIGNKVAQKVRRIALVDVLRDQLVSVVCNRLVVEHAGTYTVLQMPPYYRIYAFDSVFIRLRIMQYSSCRPLHEFLYLYILSPRIIRIPKLV